MIKSLCVFPWIWNMHRMQNLISVQSYVYTDFHLSLFFFPSKWLFEHTLLTLKSKKSPLCGYVTRSGEDSSELWAKMKALALPDLPASQAHPSQRWSEGSLNTLILRKWHMTLLVIVSLSMVRDFALVSINSVVSGRSPALHHSW